MTVTKGGIVQRAQRKERRFGIKKTTIMARRTTSKSPTRANVLRGKAERKALLVLLVCVALFSFFNTTSDCTSLCQMPARIVVVVVVVFVSAADRTGQDRTEQDRTGQTCLLTLRPMFRRYWSTVKNGF